MRAASRKYEGIALAFFFTATAAPIDEADDFYGVQGQEDESGRLGEGVQVPQGQEAAKEGQKGSRMQLPTASTTTDEDRHRLNPELLRTSQRVVQTFGSRAGSSP